MLTITLKLVFRTPPSRWPCDTVGEATARIGAMVGLDPSGDWLVGSVQREAEFEAEVLIETGWDLNVPTQLESVRRNLEDTLAMPLSWLPLGSRDHESLNEALESNERFREVNKKLVDEHEELVLHLEAIKASVSWRLTEPVRTVSNFARRRS